MDMSTDVLDGSTTMHRLHDHPNGPVSSSPATSQAISNNVAGKDPSDNTPTGQVHDGRAVYFESIEERVVESTKAYPQTSAVSSADMAALQCYRAFELPSRSIKACYIDNFFRYCYPWLPVVEPIWLRETPTQKPSILLLQAVLLAGSRVTTPNDINASVELYARCKALFFSNYEQNPVIRIITCLLMRWWNPAGPDRVCMDSSHFWISTGVSIAVAIGLHEDSAAHAKDASYRRRLWWSAVVSNQLVAVTSSC